MIPILSILAGFVLLIIGAEFLVRGASRLAVTAGISPLVVGLTVVAYGTSAPELAVSVQSAYAGAADIALGNVIGSNIANILLILGVSALIIPLVVAHQLIRLDVPIMIGLSILVWIMGFDGVIGRLDGLILVAGGITYTVFAIWQSRKENKLATQEFEQEFGGKAKTGIGHILLQIGFIIAGLILLVQGANWLVNGAVTLAKLLGISELVIGLTIVAVGTSLPEAATSVVAAIKGERDIAVGNIIGSNIFNILIVLGLTGVVATNGINVPTAALYFNIPVMIAVAVVCLPIFFTGSLISRWEGLLFLGSYAAYLGYLLLSTTQNQGLDTFDIIITGLILLLTVVVLIIPTFRAVKTNRMAKHV